MDPYEPTNLLLSKIKALEPENASKIMGYILIQDISERDLLRLALGPENLLQNVIFKAKTHLGISQNTLSTTPNSPSLLNPLSRPQNNHNPFSQTSPGVLNECCFQRNQSPHSWPIQGLCNNGDSSNSSSSISPKSSPFLSYDNIRAGSVVMPPFSKSDSNVSGSSCSNNNGGGDFLDEYQLDDYFSFLDDSSSRNEELLECRGQPGSYGVSNGENHLHRRRFSESDLCFGGEDGGLGMGFRPCMYFARGFCKNGENCKFVHSGFGCDSSGEINGGNESGGIGGSPREVEGLFLQQQEEMMRMKAAQQQQQRLAYGKYMNFLLQQQQNDPERLGAAAALMGDEYHKFGQFGPERNEILTMGVAEKANSASRQIYLTFPADSTFKDEDVSNYFSNFGPVQDVRIPYQQKRMFGFVTFVHPETVRRILHRGNPHFICDSRVLVKPYKEKGKVANNSRRQLHLQQQLFESGSFSPSSSPSALSPRELYDLHLGARMFHNMQEVMLRRKLEEQSELQQAIEIQGRRLINLQLPDLRGDFVHNHQRSVSVGAPFSLHSHSPIDQNVILCSDVDNQETLDDNGGNSVAAVSLSAVSADENDHHDASTHFQKNVNVNDKEESSLREGRIDNECQVKTVNHDLPAVLFTSTKLSGNHHDGISRDATAVTKGSESENNASVLAPSSNAASQ